MTKIYFVRHAEPNFNNHDDLTRELSAKGLADRRLVTDFLEDKQINAVFSSPYKRAIDTVKQFADAKGLLVGLIDDFRERKITDEWIKDFHDFAKKQWEDFSYKLPGGESLSEVQNRNIAALRQLLKTYRDKNIAVGTHGTALSTIINYYNPSFGYDAFDRIRVLMPWIVAFTFDGDKAVSIEAYDLFQNCQPCSFTSPMISSAKP